MLAYSSTEHGHIAHQTRVAQQAKSCCGVKMGNLQGLKADSYVLLDSFLNIKDRTKLKCDMQLKTDMIQGAFYERYNFYMDSCAISPLDFLLTFLSFY